MRTTTCLDNPLGPSSLTFERTPSSDGTVDGGESRRSDLVLDKRLKLGGEVSELVCNKNPELSAYE